jgi:hypothetical protein
MKKSKVYPSFSVLNAMDGISKEILFNIMMKNVRG